MKAEVIYLNNYIYIVTTEFVKPNDIVFDVNRKLIGSVNEVNNQEVVFFSHYQTFRSPYETITKVVATTDKRLSVYQLPEDKAELLKLYQKFELDIYVKFNVGVTISIPGVFSKFLLDKRRITNKYITLKNLGYSEEYLDTLDMENVKVFPSKTVKEVVISERTINDLNNALDWWKTLSNNDKWDIYHLVNRLGGEFVAPEDFTPKQIHALQILATSFN